MTGRDNEGSKYEFVRSPLETPKDTGNNGGCPRGLSQLERSWCHLRVPIPSSRRLQRLRDGYLDDDENRKGGDSPIFDGLKPESDRLGVPSRLM